MLQFPCWRVQGSFKHIMTSIEHACSLVRAFFLSFFLSGRISFSSASLGLKYYLYLIDYFITDCWIQLSMMWLRSDRARGLSLFLNAITSVSFSRVAVFDSRRRKREKKGGTSWHVVFTPCSCLSDIYHVTPFIPFQPGLSLLSIPYPFPHSFQVDGMMDDGKKCYVFPVPRPAAFLDLDSCSVLVGDRVTCCLSVKKVVWWKRTCIQRLRATIMICNSLFALFYSILVFLFLSLVWQVEPSRRRLFGFARNAWCSGFRSCEES